MKIFISILSAVAALAGVFGAGVLVGKQGVIDKPLRNYSDIRPSIRAQEFLILGGKTKPNFF